MSFFIAKYSYFVFILVFMAIYTCTYILILFGNFNFYLGRGMCTEISVRISEFVLYEFHGVGEGGV